MFSRICPIWLICLIIFVTVSLCHCVTASAASLSVSLSVGLTYFAAEGYTSPMASIVLKENGSTIATSVADEQGYFTISTLGYDGLHTYNIYAIDSNGLFTDTVSQTVSLIPGTTTTIGNLILPPTFHFDNLDIEIGQDVTVKGMGVPLSTITLFFDSSSMSTTQIDKQGLWSFNFSTDNLSSGTHSFYFKNSTVNGYSSENTTTSYLTLRPRNLSTPVPSGGAITATIAPVHKLPWWLAPFDENNNNRLELGELKYSVTHWFEYWLEAIRAHKVGTCDLNQDGVCDLIDLSILLYYIDK